MSNQSQTKSDLLAQLEAAHARIDELEATLAAYESGPRARARDLELRLEAIADHMLGLEALLGNDGRLRWISPAVQQWTGYSAEECLATPDYPMFMVYEDDRERIARCLREAKAGSSGDDLPFRIRRRDGSVGAASLTWRPVRASELGQQGFRVCIRDVTERARAEEALQHSQALLNLLAMHVSDAVFWKDRHGRYQGCNEAFARSAGERSPDDVVGRTDAELGWPKDQAERFRRHDETVLSANAPVRRLAEVERLGDGRTADVLTTRVALRDGSDRVCGLLGVKTEITDRKRLEQQRREIEARLRFADKQESLSVLAGGVAHDFNNLLTGVLASTSLATEMLPAESPVQMLLQQIDRSARRAADLTRQMLAFSGKGRFLVGPVSLSALVRGMKDLLRATVSKKAVLHWEIEPDLPPVNADDDQLRQVVVNLAVNASEALGDRSGDITVRTGVLAANDEYLAGAELGGNLPAGSYAFVAVSDTGCGIDDAVRARMFEPFFTRKTTGRGLGLSAVQGIVRGHHGAIHVASAIDKGTTMTVLFPVMEAPVVEAAEATPAPRSRPRGTPTVLVADDEESVRAVASLALQRSQFNVLSAGDGREALEVFRQHADEIDVVLLDMTMPYLSGDEVFRAMRRVRPNVKVVLSSGYAEEDALSRFAGADLAGFIQKPYGPELLVERIRAAATGPSG